MKYDYQISMDSDKENDFFNKYKQMFEIDPVQPTLGPDPENVTVDIFGYSSLTITLFGVFLTCIIICCIRRKRNKQSGAIVTTVTQSSAVAVPYPVQSPMPQPIQAGMVNTPFPMLQPYPGAYSPNMTPYPPPQIPYPSAHGPHPMPAAPYPPNVAPYSSPPPSYAQVISSAYDAPVTSASAPLLEIEPDTAQSFWVEASEGSIPPNAIIGGHDGENMYIGRAYHGKALVPGKILPSHGCCYIPWGGEEHKKNKYQVLCGESSKWIQVKGSDFPASAIPGGNTEIGEPLFIGRVAHKGTLTVGRVQGSHKVCYISHDEEELAFKKYEILVQ